MTLTEFLLTRIASDEVVAREAEEDYLRHGEPTMPQTWIHHDHDCATWAPAVGMGYARVLAECEAKRRIVEEHTCGCPDPGCGECGACSGGHHADPTPAPCPTLRILAAVYADHPDYDETWRP